MKTTVKPSVSFLFDSRRNPPEIYTINWNVYYAGKQKPFSTGTKLERSDVEWLKANKDGIDGRQKDQHRINLWNMMYGQTFVDVDGVERDSFTVMAKKVISELDVFTFDGFLAGIRSYYEEKPIPEPEEPKLPDDIIKVLSDHTEELHKKKQIGSGNSHRDTKRSLLRFIAHRGNDEELTPRKLITIEAWPANHNGPDPCLSFRQITVPFLEEYERWMLQYGKAPKAKAKQTRRSIRDQEANPQKYLPSPASLATVGIYCRYIRKMMLLAVEAKLITEDQYPFKGPKSFVIPEVENAARSLELEDVVRIIEFKPETKEDLENRDLWVFAYLCNGMNMMDLINLRKENYSIAQMTATFFREKVKRTSRARKREIRVTLIDEAKSIIDKWGSKDNNSPYIFPYLTSEMDAKKIKSIDSQMIKKVNVTMKSISKALNLPFSVRFNDARDTRATILIHSGASLPFVQEDMGHAKPSTTTRYVGRFSDPQTRQIISALLPKKKEDSQIAEALGTEEEGKEGRD